MGLLILINCLPGWDAKNNNNDEEYKTKWMIIKRSNLMKLTRGVNNLGTN